MKLALGVAGAALFAVSVNGQADLTISNLTTSAIATDTQSLQISGMLGVSIRNVGTASIAIPFRILAWEDRNNNLLREDSEPILGSLLYSAGVSSGGETTVQIPVAGTLLFRGNLIAAKADTDNAVSETREDNNAKSTADGSRFIPPSSVFSPVLKWSWTASSKQPSSLNVMTPPLVVDINGDGSPDILFGSTPDTGGVGVRAGHLRALNGATGEELFTIDQVSPVDLRIDATCTLAFGDIDGDELPEIIACDTSGHGLIAFEHDGTFKWRNPNLEAIGSGAPSLADLNHDGKPEIIFGRQVLDGTGSLLWTGTQTKADLVWGLLSVVSDVDLDGEMEIIAGPTVYSAQGDVKYGNTSLPDGANGIGNFDSDPQAEIILVSNGQIWLLEHDLSIKWGPVTIPGGGRGGPPTVADFDNDGEPEIGVAGASRYAVFETNGTLRWATAIQDPSSNLTGSSVFDFDGDGAAEAVYRDEQFLYVFRGADGVVLFKTPLSSCTWYEYPVVADVTGDGRAEIVTGANNNCGFGPDRGVFVFGDSLNNWVRTRAIWNQHSYHITNINDDGTVPTHEQANWLQPGLNNFRLNTFAQPEKATSAPDATSSLIRKSDGPFPASVQLTARIGNGGSGITTTGSSSLGPNVVENGSFETATAACNYQGGASVSITGWQMPGTMRYAGPAQWNAGEGNCSVELYDSAIRQSIPTQRGKLYELSFLLAGNPNTTDPLRVLQVTIGGQVHTLSFDTSGKSPSAMGFERQRIRVLAQSTSTLIQFISQTPVRGIVIDDIQLRQFSDEVLFVDDFEDDTPSGATLLKWDILRGGVDIYRHHAFCETGDNTCLDLDGTFTGAVRMRSKQSFALQQGRTYTLQWRFRGNQRAPGTSDTATVTLGDVSQTFVLADPESWKWYAFQVTPNTSFTGYIEFDHQGHDDGGMILDSVILTVPPNSHATTGVRVKTFFYRGDPATGGIPLGEAETTRALMPGEYEDVSITWNNPPAGLHPIVVVADPDNLIQEGDETNNKAGANILLGIGPFPTVDDLTARFKNQSVDIRWGAIAGATGYNVYRRTSTGALVLVRRGGTGTAFSDTGLTNGTVYYYSVRWINAQGVESGDGTEASATPTLIPTTDTPPTILSVPVVRATAQAPYSYQLRAADPDAGDVLTYALLAAPAGMTIGPTGLIVWLPSTTQGGYSRVHVRVTDSRGRIATQSYALFADVQLVNAPPLITSTAITQATSGELYAYQVTGRDPENGLLFYTLDLAPVGMAINQSTGLIQWTPSRSQLGDHAVTVKATDFGGLSAVQSFVVHVIRGNKGPYFTSTPVLTGSVGQPYGYQAFATDPEDDPIAFSLAAGPSGMTVSAAGLVEWAPSASQEGLQAVSLRVADDSGLNALQNFTITVRPPNHPPTISSTPRVTAEVAALYAYQVTATDPNLPDDGLTYSLLAAPEGMTIQASTGLIQWVPQAAFADTDQSVTVQVRDLAGATDAQSFEIHVSPQDLERPSVSFTSSLNGTTLTTDTPVIGTIQDNNLTLWRLEYRPVNVGAWITLASGTEPVVEGQLGVIPATLLANDVYRFRLYAEDTGGSITTPEMEVRVDTQQLKMGDFTLAFEDMRIPGFTFPISLLRKYDSKRPAIGDFGPGWALGFNEVDVRVDVNYNVFLTLPDGRRTSFRYTPTGGFLSVFNTAFTAEGGVYDTLENLDCPQVLGVPPNALCNGFQLWQPNNWRLKTKEGITYIISGKSITRMEDRAGNWIQIALNGITSNTGRNVVIERDGQNLITKIAAPDTESVPGGEVRYQYDPQGRLIAFIDQNGKATTFTYENTNFPHYLTRITDALGRVLIRNVFNAEGRLVAQCDPNGDIVTLTGCTTFDPQPGLRTFKAINGRGFRTDLITDEHGNVVTERRYLDATNYLETVRTYDANNNLLTERDPEGNERTFTYDTRGNRLTETDPGGRTTTYTYVAGCDKVERIVDPAGNVTVNTYDAQCNLRFVRDALQNSTEYRYNSAGQRTQMIDPNGTTWTWNYLPNGLLQSVVDPFGKATTFSFDNKGNLLSRTDRNNRRIDFQYDSANRLTRETWDTGRVTTYVYDDAGSLRSAVDPDSSLTMAYDNLGRLLGVDNVGTPGAPRVVMTYSYDANGNTTQVQDSLGGVTEYGYDGMDRLVRVTQSGTGVQPKRVDISYTPASLLAQLRRYSDLAGTQGVANTSYEYDCSGCPDRLTAIRHRKASDNSVIHDLTFARDPLGNITTMTDAEGTHTYLYDVIRRLTSAIHPPGGVQPNEFYTYDAVGNRLTSHLSHFYTYSWQTEGKGNRLLQNNQYDYIYDGEGNLLQRTDRVTGFSISYRYDYRNRLVEAILKSVSQGKEERSEYVYDPFGHQIRSLVGLEEHFTTYDMLNPVIKLARDGSVITRRIFSRMLDGIVGDESHNSTRWFLLDQVNTVRDLIANDGSAINHYVFDSFGRFLHQSDPSIWNELLFSSREINALTGEGFYRGRFYDSRTGRFSAEDRLLPFGYGYVENNPLVAIDPLGLSAMMENIFMFSAVANMMVNNFAATKFMFSDDCQQRFGSNGCLLLRGGMMAGEFRVLFELAAVTPTPATIFFLLGATLFVALATGPLF